ncbi:MaoC/PaaZ C-terminal domain-containing protein [Roseibacterium sp. SDUM158016]|jgi:acyl dehydratase|uniref:MaoC/PaaZ C-terminal domain-containing protein n=1 Tax=Roseicyclus sediminis TaxID=2980997 RepID=UPI0021D059BF|nr:MaoC/PaaZ C-terminal domain-containing protein [Roseibacterium sp. SDUM158016]MCU4652115.1 MaoC/PaaZ C-terminal domain-containing protein [Roseibacterium sp. SDUM158016]
MTDDILWSLDDVPADAMAEWCAALNDDNAIHLDRAAAEANGFGPRRVNPGPANLAYLLNALMAAGRGNEIVEIEARFLGNVLEGDRVLVAGTPATPGMEDTRLTLARVTGPGAEDIEPVLQARIGFNGRRPEE